MGLKQACEKRGYTLYALHKNSGLSYSQVWKLSKLKTDKVGMDSVLAIWRGSAKIGHPISPVEYVRMGAVDRLMFKDYPLADTKLQ